MTNEIKQWPKCQTTAPEHIVAHHDSTLDEPFCNAANAWDSPERMSAIGLHGAKYTRTYLAEARIAELERENARLQKQLDAGTEAGWHALRNERDELRARIEDAPSRIAEMGAWDVAPQQAF